MVLLKNSSVLKLESISNEQHLQLKNIAYDKMGVSALWNEKETEQRMHLQNIQHERDKIEQLKRDIDKDRRHGKEVSNLVNQKAAYEQRLLNTQGKLGRTQDLMRYIVRNSS